MKKFLVILYVMVLFGCGYQMVGKETHVPSGISSLAIPTFRNLTFEPGIEVYFTRGFLREFIMDRRVKVVDREEADSILEGVIKSFDISSVSYDRSGFAMEYQTSIVIDLVLKRRNGEIIWVERDLSETRTYGVSSSTITTEGNKSAAVQQIGRFVAERVRNRFFYDF